MVTYTCRYSSGHLIPIIQSCQRLISAGVGDHSCFLTFYTVIPINCKITNFSLYLLYLTSTMFSCTSMRKIMTHKQHGYFSQLNVWNLSFEISDTGFLQYIFMKLQWMRCRTWQQVELLVKNLLRTCNTTTACLSSIVSSFQH